MSERSKEDAPGSSIHWPTLIGTLLAVIFLSARVSKLETKVTELEKANKASPTAQISPEER